MLVSLLDARELLLPAVLWAGDAIVTHNDGREEIVHNVRVVEAARSIYGFKVSYPRRQRRAPSQRRVRRCPQGIGIHDPEIGCCHGPRRGRR
jgi:hypothetical protein